MASRDDFTKSTKSFLARRVGYRCSNPTCRTPTVGPSEEADGVVSIGVAAHITAAAENGPRYDPTLSSGARRESENGIWLCQNCAKLIDSDLAKFSAHVLRAWKRAAEVSAALELGLQERSPAVVAYTEALAAMPELLLDMSQALRNRDTSLLREFFVLESRRLHLGGSSKPRMTYYEEDYVDLRVKLDILLDYGFLSDVTVGNVPILRLTPEFVRLLLTEIPPTEVG